MEFIPGPMELVIILIIVAMLFGVGRLPEVFGAVGRGIREFRSEMATKPEAAKPVVQQPAEKMATVETNEPAPVSEPVDQPITQEA